MDLSPVRNNGTVNVEEEASNKVVNADFAQFLGEPRRTDKVEKHKDALFAYGPMVSPEHKIHENARPDKT